MLERTMRLGGAVLERPTHVCAFFYTPDDEYQVLLPFVKEGFEQGDKGVHILDGPEHAEHVRRIQGAGIDVDSVQTNRQLDILTWEETYLQGGRFEQNAMIDTLVGALQSARADGFPRTRIVAHAEWVIEDWPGTTEWVEYESRLNYVLPQYDDAVVCTYSLGKLGGPLVLDVLRAHPMVLIGGALQENPFYVPPDDLIPELRQRSSRTA